MHVVREAVRLLLDETMELSNRDIAKRVGINHGTVGTYKSQLKEHSLSWLEVSEMSDSELELKLKTPKGRKKQVERPQPDYKRIHQELKRPGVTMQLLWEEYLMANPDGYQRSQFCFLYKEWTTKLNVSLRLVHKAGEKLFIDYSGKTVPIRDSKSGETRNAEIFVATFGASNYSYVEATWSQSMEDWIGSHVRAFNYFGGVPTTLVPDNLKSAVTTPCRFDPVINRTYQEMCTHYGTSVIPARVRKPKDKAKVEGSVLIAQRWILAALRNHVFFSLQELNRSIAELLEKLNQRAFSKMKGCRSELFELLDAPALKPLPITPYVFAEWKQTRAGMDYHIELEEHHYSVPYRIAGKQVQVCYTAKIVEIFWNNHRVASHLKSNIARGKTTSTTHMPKHHSKYAAWSPKEMLEEAQKIGPATVAVMEKIQQCKKSVDYIYRNCTGLLTLTRDFSAKRLENACKRALSIDGCNYRSLRSILDNGLDRVPVESPETTREVEHENIRGKNFYHFYKEPMKPREKLC